MTTGVIDGSLFASSEPTLTGAARRLAIDFGEFFVPTPGRRENKFDQASTVDGRQAWTAGYTVVPTDPAAGAADIRLTVVQDGERRVFALVIVTPADAATPAAASATVSAIRFG